MYINEVKLYGRLGRDPELKSLPNGTPVVTFTMATTRSWKDESGQKKEQTEWHNLVCFGKRADVIAKYVKKGDSFYVTGRLQTRSWEDKETQKKMYRTEIFVVDFQFGDRKAGSDSYQSQGGESTAPRRTEESKNDAIDYPDEEINPDDIPF
ncbi:TPA: single-stranded DNA-binding protein [Patescibacteria group bacterium]|nr:MAG: Single-stranded DNA-binding protein [Parcubacteria group bacterium GW2011_GWD2_42_14]HCC05266.1 single-stranded DNA-binding protein [Patescibacteria group bacterium]